MAPGNLIDQLVRDEGEVLHAYQDEEGYWTIGVGTCIDARKSCGITQEESRYLLQNRIDLAAAQVRTRLPWTLHVNDGIRLAVLINLCFNEGIEHLLGFAKMLAAFEAGNWTAAAAELLNSKLATEENLRAHRLALQLETGQWL